MIDFNFFTNITFVGILPILILGGGGMSIVVWFIQHPEKAEYWYSLLCRMFRNFFSVAEKKYVKYSIQSTVNSYLSDVAKTIPSLKIQRVKLQWISNETSEESFIQNNRVVIRLKKSTVANRNVANATFMFVKYALLVKAKRYIAKYQQQAIDMFTVTKILEKNDQNALREFVEIYLHSAMESDKVNDLYGKFEDINSFGLYFPAFITEMTFLGEKVFSKRRNDKAIYEEVNALVNFLYNFSHRKISDKNIADYTGAYCKCAIRILGKQYKIANEGRDVYIRNIQNTCKESETIYLIGDNERKNFIDDVVQSVLVSLNLEIYSSSTYTTIIKNRDGEPKKAKSYIVVLRKKDLPVYYKQ